MQRVARRSSARNAGRHPWWITSQIAAVQVVYDAMFDADEKGLRGGKHVELHVELYVDPRNEQTSAVCLRDAS